MEKIISEINAALKELGISQTQLAKSLELDQKRVNNLLAGRTKRLDPDIIRKLQIALGLNHTYGASVNAEELIAMGMAEPARPAIKKAELSPFEEQILGLTDKMSPEDQATALKSVMEIFISSQTKEK